MAQATMKTAPSPLWSMSRLRKHLGMIPAERILRFPYNGPAAVEDAVYLDDHRNVICELFDGILVRKPFGADESRLAAIVAAYLCIFVPKGSLGVVLGAAGMLEILPGQVRIPDVAFISKKRFPGGKRPKKKAWPVVPDLAVEILSESNTPKEMARKRREYFAQGTVLVWQINPEKKIVEVFNSATESKVYHVGQTLDGGDVLPGFKLKVSEVFED
ncbi:MAG TPA: Uma2 family endonuclease [Gemmataceae bacterium]|nr:Uma2 family endonuclease [Gemmataceae bacterium]